MSHVIKNNDNNSDDEVDIFAFNKEPMNEETSKFVINSNKKNDLIINNNDCKSYTDNSFNSNKSKSFSSDRSLNMDLSTYKTINKFDNDINENYDCQNHIVKAVSYEKIKKNSKSDFYKHDYNKDHINNYSGNGNYII